MKDLNKMSCAELRTLAKESKMPGAWKANKATMIAYLNENSSQINQNEPECTEEVNVNDLSAEVENESEGNPEQPKMVPTPEPDAPKLKVYMASVRDKETKEIKTILGKAKNRTEFYNQLKADNYRVRFMATREKFEEESKLFPKKHAEHKALKNAKYAADKALATEMNMTVAEYRQRVRTQK